LDIENLVLSSGDSPPDLALSMSLVLHVKENSKPRDK